MASTKKTARNILPSECEDREKHNQEGQWIRRTRPHADVVLMEVQKSFFHPGGRELFLFRSKDPTCEDLGWKTVL